MSSLPHGDIPALVKALQTGFVALLVPIYWRHYGPGNFLWFSDLALFASVAALWMQSSLLASMLAVGVVALEFVWTAEFCWALVAGRQTTGLAAYMFNRNIPLGIRALSLFHLWLSPLILWMVWTYGYDPRALRLQTLVACVVLPASYFLTQPAANVNWVRGWGNRPQTKLPPWIYLLLWMAILPLAVYVPSHLLLAHFLPPR